MLDNKSLIVSLALKITGYAPSNAATFVSNVSIFAINVDIKNEFCRGYFGTTTIYRLIEMGAGSAARAQSKFLFI